MHWDVVDLREFYTSSLGKIALRAIRGRVREIWPDLKGADVLGLGYASPFLQSFRGEADRVLNLMPAGQGVVHWPVAGPNLACLVDDLQLPLGDGAIDRIMLVHSIESSEALAGLMKEIWRVLAPGGRVMVLVPNRLSWWARSDRTPYGHGRPFSKTQLINLLRKHQFSLQVCHRALFFPPFSRRFLLKGARVWDGVGAKVWPQQGGVLIAEATKQIYALPERKRSVAKLRRAHPGLKPAVVNSQWSRQHRP
jgi:SAM-dependent methyltransferase